MLTLRNATENAPNILEVFLFFEWSYFLSRFNDFTFVALNLTDLNIFFKTQQFHSIANLVQTFQNLKTVIISVRDAFKQPPLTNCLTWILPMVHSFVSF